MSEEGSVESFEVAQLFSPTSQAILRGDSPAFESPSVTVPPQVAVTKMATPPRFGGKYEPVFWVGGPPKKDWSASALTEMKTPMSIRGLDPANEQKGFKSRVLYGSEVKFKRDDQTFDLASFAMAAKSHMETYGMDTFFYMVGTDDPEV